MNPILQQALSLAQSGVSVLPIRTDGSKKPAVESWLTFQEEIAPPATIREWFGNGKDQGIAGICGEVSGKLEVIDIDAPELVKPFLSLAGEMGLGDLVRRLPLIKTPSGGAHVAYRCSDGVQGNTKLARRRVTQDHVDTLIETRGEKGYVILPGSPLACHPDGKAYQLIRGDLTQIPNITGQERNLLLDVSRSFNEFFEHSFKESKVQTHGQGPLGDRPGDEFNRSTTWDQILISHEWKKVYTRGETTYWQRPGKKGPGISATTNHKGCDLLYVFSSNAYPFDSEKSYSKFAAFTILDHGGDFSAAAGELATKGRPQKQVSLGTDSGPNPKETRVEVADLDRDLEQEEVVPQLTIESEAFHGIVGDIVKTIEPHTEADPVALLGQLLVSLGNLIGYGPYVKADGGLHGTNLFAILVGKSSKARKGTSWGWVHSIMKKVDEIWESKRIAGGLSSGEGLIYAVRDSLGKDTGIDDKRLLVVETEFSAPLKAMNREGCTLSAIIRQAFDRQNLRTLTRNSPLSATDPHVSIIGHVTASELKMLLTEVQCWNGFSNRFLWLFTRRSKLLPEGGKLDSEALVPFLEPLRKAVCHARKIGEVDRTEEFIEHWREVYPALSREHPGLLGAVISRAEALTLRLSLIYALLDCSPNLGAKHLEAALAVWQYAEDSARLVFGKKAGDPLANKILEWLGQSGDKGLSKTEISNRLGRNQKAERIDEALDTLRRLGLVDCIYQETEGRSTEIWKLKTAN